MDLTPEQRATLPTPDDVSFYREHGWWVSPPCITCEMIDDLSYGLERYYEGERDMLLPISPGTDWTEALGKVLRQNDYLSLQIMEFYRFVRHPLLPAMASILSGSQTIRLFHDQILYKPPGGNSADTVVGWHTDRAYWKTCTSDSMLTAWVPLQDSTLEMGTLAVLDRSHTFSENERLHTFDQKDLTAVEKLVAASGGQIDPVQFVLKKGQVSFHNCLTIHGSYSNQSNKPRVAFAIHYQDATNSYRKVSGSEGGHVAHINDLLCKTGEDGLPDYSDPLICPKLWPPDV